MDKAIKQLIDQMRKDTQENIRRIMREAARQARGDFEREAKHYIDKCRNKSKCHHRQTNNEHNGNT